MIKNLFFVSVLLSAFILVGCKSTNKVMGGGTVGGVTMTKADFTVSGDTSGEGCSTQILLVDWSRLFKSEVGRAGSFGGVSMMGNYAAAQATYNAISKVEDATYFVLGHTSEKTTSFLPFYYKSCVTVHGKAVTIQSTK